jgi:hypothetical protein
MEPTDPIDRIDPLELIDRIDPLELTERIDPERERREVTIAPIAPIVLRPPG